jgi:hypothetical protein
VSAPSAVLAKVVLFQFVSVEATYSANIVLVIFWMAASIINPTLLLLHVVSAWKGSS